MKFSRYKSNLFVVGQSVYRLHFKSNLLGYLKLFDICGFFFFSQYINVSRVVTEKIG